MIVLLEGVVNIVHDMSVAKRGKVQSEFTSRLRGAGRGDSERSAALGSEHRARRAPARHCRLRPPGTLVHADQLRRAAKPKPSSPPKGGEACRFICCSSMHLVRPDQHVVWSEPGGDDSRLADVVISRVLGWPA
jgi:hypothetical protein